MREFVSSEFNSNFELRSGQFNSALILNIPVPYRHGLDHNGKWIIQIQLGESKIIGSRIENNEGIIQKWFNTTKNKKNPKIK